MKRSISILVLFVCFNVVCFGACPDQIKTFYTAYLNNVLHDDAKNEALCKTYLTEELIEKVNRLTNATGADPIIRAQDANEDGIETLTVKDLAGNWYLVSYFWMKGDNDTLIEIPLKAQDIEGNCKITYITPVWNGSQYGDELLTCKGARTNRIDQTSELLFLKSFYDAYIAEYCNMPANLNSKLSFLRSHYLSQSALDQFKHAELENREDGLAGYDRLIDNFDFDCSWCKDVKFRHLKDNAYQFSYRVGTKVYEIVVTVKKQDKLYLIDGFEV